MPQHPQITATQRIAELFANHDVNVAVDDDVIEFVDRAMQMQVNCFFNEHDSGQRTMQLDVVLHYGIKPIIESFSGWGDDDDSLVHDAVQNFSLSSFHVLLSAFFNDHFDEQIDQETWQIGKQTFTATIGNVISRGDVPDTLGTAWFNEYQQAVQKLPLSDGVHWLRLYYGQADNRAIAYEALLDNEHCQAIMPLVEHFSWQASDDFYSVRVFLVVKGGMDIGRMAYLIARADEPHQAIEPLQALGLSQLDAEKAVVFIPEAFSMVLMKQVGVQGDLPTHAQAVNEHDQTIELDLSQEPIFQNALQLAQELWEQGYHDELQQLAFIGAGMKLLDGFLADDDSHEPEQLHFDDVRTLFYVAGLPLPAEPETATTEPVEVVQPTEKKSKPFWKFW